VHKQRGTTVGGEESRIGVLKLLNKILWKRKINGLGIKTIRRKGLGLLRWHPPNSEEGGGTQGIINRIPGTSKKKKGGGGFIYARL